MVLIINRYRTIFLSVTRVCELTVRHFLVKLVRHVEIAASGHSRARGHRDPITVMTNNIYPIKSCSIILFRARNSRLARTAIPRRGPSRRFRAARFFRRTALIIHRRAGLNAGRRLRGTGWAIPARFDNIRRRLVVTRVETAVVIAACRKEHHQTKRHQNLFHFNHFHISQ